MAETKNLRELEERIGYHFQDIRLLEHALRHTSYSNEQRMGHEGSNERLEFLGDAVLELVSSEYLYDHYPHMSEGDLTKLRASLVCEPTLAYDARQFGLQEFVFLGKGEENTGGRKRDSVISDALEATIGAVFKDGGFAEAKKYILRYIMDDVENKQLFHDSKTRLQEMMQAVTDKQLVYAIIGESGPDHNKTFEAEVRLDGQLLGTGRGHSKKIAEQQAAFQAILSIQNQNRK